MCDESDTEESACQNVAGQPFAAELPKYALEALRPLLEIWERAGATDWRLREETLAKEQLKAVSSSLPCHVEAFHGSTGWTRIPCKRKRT